MNFFLKSARTFERKYSQIRRQPSIEAHFKRQGIYLLGNKFLGENIAWNFWPLIARKHYYGILDGWNNNLRKRKFWRRKNSNEDGNYPAAAESRFVLQKLHFLKSLLELGTSEWLTHYNTGLRFFDEVGIWKIKKNKIGIISGRLLLRNFWCAHLRTSSFVNSIPTLPNAERKS